MRGFFLCAHLLFLCQNCLPAWWFVCVVEWHYLLSHKHYYFESTAIFHVDNVCFALLRWKRSTSCSAHIIAFLINQPCSTECLQTSFPGLQPRRSLLWVLLPSKSRKKREPSESHLTDDMHEHFLRSFIHLMFIQHRRHGRTAWVMSRLARSVQIYRTRRHINKLSCYAYVMMMDEFSKCIKLTWSCLRSPCLSKELPSDNDRHFKD